MIVFDDNHVKHYITLRVGVGKGSVKVIESDKESIFTTEQPKGKCFFLNTHSSCPPTPARLHNTLNGQATLPHPPIGWMFKLISIPLFTPTLICPLDRGSVRWLDVLELLPGRFVQTSVWTFLQMLTATCLPQHKVF